MPHGIAWLSKNTANACSLDENFHGNISSKKDSNAVTNAVHCSCDISSTTNVTMCMDGGSVYLSLKQVATSICSSRNVPKKLRLEGLIQVQV